MNRKIALIGHSGSGKTTCSTALSGVEMDLGLFPPNRPPTINEMVNWMKAQTRHLIVVGVHKETLKEMADAKQNGDYFEFFEKFMFVYFTSSKELLRARLTAQVEKRERNQDSNQIINDFDELDSTFKRLRDVEIDTSFLSAPELVALIRAICAATSGMS
jgi:hypothetical protein